MARPSAVAVSPCQPEAAPFKRGFIPVWLHIVVSMTAVISGFVGALLLAVVVLHRLRLSGQSVDGFFIYALLTFVAVLVPLDVMYKLIPARCSQCGGRCWAPSPKRNDTLKYICEHCGKALDTQMGGGAGG